MTSTERLRALLDERGVEWQDFDGEPTWMGSDGRMHYARYEFTFNGPTDELTVYHLTPEQAIAATVGNGTDLSKRLREVHGLHAFAELFGFSWEDESDWDWYDVACAMADAIDATAGKAMTLDQAIERIEKFMGDYAKVLLESTLYVEREPTDQHAFDVAERKEAQMARDLAEALATANTEPDEATMLKLHSRMNAALLDMNDDLLALHTRDRENASSKKLIDCVIRAHQIIEDAAKVGVGTCRNISDSPSGFLCSECGWGDFNEPSHLLTTTKFTDNDRGPNYCPNCGKLVTE